MPNINPVDESELDMNDQDRTELRALQKSFNDYKVETTETLRQMQATLQRIANTISGDPDNDIDGIVAKIRKIQLEVDENRDEAKALGKARDERLAKLESAHTKIIAYAVGTAFAVSIVWQVGKWALGF